MCTVYRGVVYRYWVSSPSPTMTWLHRQTTVDAEPSTLSSLMCCLLYRRLTTSISAATRWSVALSRCRLYWSRRLESISCGCLTASVTETHALEVELTVSLSYRLTAVLHWQSSHTARVLSPLGTRWSRNVSVDLVRHLLSIAGTLVVDFVMFNTFCCGWFLCTLMELARLLTFYEY